MDLETQDTVVMGFTATSVMDAAVQAQRIAKNTGGVVISLSGVLVSWADAVSLIEYTVILVFPKGKARTHE